RALSYSQKGAIPAYMSAKTREQLTLRFDYAFTSSHTNERLYPAIMDDRSFVESFTVEGIPVTAFPQNHGNAVSWGFRIGDFGYSTDAVALDENAFAKLAGVKLWIVDCLREEPHPTHSHFAQSLEWIARVGPERAVLTHLNHTVDYDTLAAKCPPGVEPGYDGLTVELPEEE
ncbi:MAG: MBL fold metallo-hydrolase, partial [Rhodovibrionaceae bacterium]